MTIISPLFAAGALANVFCVWLMIRNNGYVRQTLDIMRREHAGSAAAIDVTDDELLMMRKSIVGLAL
jgi:hypothetical protein